MDFENVDTANPITTANLRRLLPARPAGRLSSVAACRREISRLYREARLGVLRPEVATRLSYVCETASKLLRVELEAKELVKLRKQLERLKGAAPLITHDIAEPESGDAVELMAAAMTTEALT